MSFLKKWLMKRHLVKVCNLTKNKCFLGASQQTFGPSCFVRALVCTVFYNGLVGMLVRYSKASRYTASRCTDLDNARFWKGSKNIWDTRFWWILLEKHEFFGGFSKIFWDARFFDKLLLEMHGFLISPIGYLSLFCTYTMEVFLKEHYNFQLISIETSRSILSQNYLGKSECKKGE